MKTTRKSTLDEVAKAVLKDRQNAYGPPEQSFTIVAHLWAIYLDARMVKRPDGTVEVVPLQPHDVAAMMILLKVARLALNPANTDGWVDAAGYAVCGAEVAPEPPQMEMGLTPGDTPTPTKESCKPARASDSRLTVPEMFIASKFAHECRGITLFKYSPEEEQLISKAIITPKELSYEQFSRINTMYMGNHTSI